MGKYCENCGTLLEEGAKFCPNCGANICDEENLSKEQGTKLTHNLQTTNQKSKFINSNNHNIIILLAVIIGILIIATAILISSNPFDNTLELERYDFGVVSMDVPKGSSFYESDNIGKGTKYWAIGYNNSLQDNDELFMVWISNYDSSDIYSNYFVEQDGDLYVYKPLSETYVIQRHVGDYYVKVFNVDSDLDNLKQRARSIEIEN